MNYKDYDDRLQGRCQQRRKVQNNTYLERRDDDIAVRLHDTDVVVWHPDGSVTLDTGGWYTVTTKDRMNGYCPARVWSNRGRWMVTWGGRDVPFADGITLHPDGRITGVPDADEVAEQDRRNAETVKAIKGFVKAITPERIIEAWEHSGGDCWGCMFVAEDGSYPVTGGTCLADHVEEGYFHAHLALRAIKARGYGDPDFIMSMIYWDAQQGRDDRSLTVSLEKLLRKELIQGRAVGRVS
jgi:hypothetical protein